MPLDNMGRGGPRDGLMPHFEPRPMQPEDSPPTSKDDRSAPDTSPVSPNGGRAG